MTHSTRDVRALAIGRFDGLHRGHLALADRLGENGGWLVIDTGRSNLTPPEYFGRYTDLPFFVLPLSEIRGLDAREFVLFLAGTFPSLDRIVVGEDFRFSRDRSAGAAQLAALFPGTVEIVPEVFHGGEAVHATLVRLRLLDGDIAGANALLGREYRIVGRAESGQNIGANHLVPTLNLRTDPFLLPKEGVYVSRTTVDGIAYPSVTFLGHRVSTDGNFAVETHLIDRDVEPGVEEVEVAFVAYLRPNRYYPDLAELKEAILADIVAARSILTP